MSIINLVNSKYNLELASLDSNLVTSSVYELIDMLVEQNKLMTIEKVSIVKTGYADEIVNVRYVNHAYTKDGAKFKIGTQSELSLTGIFSRDLFNNIAHISPSGNFVTNYENNILISYIPNDYYTYNSSDSSVSNIPSHLELAIAVIYSKNHLVNLISKSYSSNNTQYESIKQYLEERLASDDTEVASGYLQELGVSFQSLQSTLPLYDTMLKNIMQDIASVVGELK